MHLFCKHDYKIVEKHEIKSAAEQLGSVSGATSVPYWFCRRAIIWVMRCEKCSHIKFHREESV